MGLASKLVKLAGVNEQLAWPSWIMVPQPGILVVGDVGTDQPEGVVLDPDVGLVERQFALAHRFHFAAHQQDAAFDGIENLVAVPSLTILGDRGD